MLWHYKNLPQNILTANETKLQLKRFKFDRKFTETAYLQQQSLAYLEPSRTSTMELFSENKKRLEQALRTLAHIQGAQIFQKGATSMPFEAT